MRLDLYLTSQKISASRSQIEKWIKKGCVKVNGKVTKPSSQVTPLDIIEITPPDIQPPSLQPQEMTLHILYEDEDLLVINKPANLVVHPGAGNQQGTLVHGLLAHCKGLSQIGGVERPGIVHRLDKGTSGVMVVAKNDFTHIELSRQLKNHEIEKIYWAVVYGKLKNKKGTIQNQLARSPKHRKKFAVVKKHGKKAVTHYQVLKEGEGISLAEATLETGRTHQIRVHFTNEGYSVVGDPLYGGHEKKCQNIRDEEMRLFFEKLDHPLLHAHTLGFMHPVQKKWMEWKAPLPAEFEKVLEWLS